MFFLAQFNNHIDETWEEEDDHTQTDKIFGFTFGGNASNAAIVGRVPTGRHPFDFMVGSASVLAGFLLTGITEVVA